MIVTVTLSPSIDKTYVIDGLYEDKLNYANKTILLPGSKGINVSRLLSSLEVPNTAIGLCGGALGDTLKELLTEENVNHDFTKTTSNIRFNVKIADIKHKTFTDVNERGEAVIEYEFQEFINNYKKYLSSTNIMVLGGSFPANLPIDIYCSLIDMANANNVKVFLDCAGEPLKYAINSAPYLITPNIYELCDCCGRLLKNDDEIIDGLLDIRKKGVKIAIATLGEDGAILCSDNGIFRMYVPPVCAINTTGAGDSFLAGIIYGIKNDCDEIDMLKYAGSFSSVKVTKEDTQMPAKEEAFTYVDDIKIKRIKTKQGLNVC